MKKTLCLLISRPRAAGGRCCPGTDLKGLAEYGVGYELAQLGKRNVTGCVACWACHKNPERGCVLPDGDFINECIRKIEDGDGLVVGSPVYFASANGTLVSLLDRVFSRSGGRRRRYGNDVQPGQKYGLADFLHRSRKSNRHFQSEAV